MGRFEEISLNEENKNLLKNNFENVKIYKKTIKFGTLVNKSPIFTIKTRSKYGDLEQYIIITKKQYVGCCLTETILFEEKFFDSCDIENYDDKYNTIYRMNLFNAKLKSILESNINFLKENNTFKKYEVTKFSEEEKEDIFKSALTLAVLENKFNEIYRLFFRNLKKEGSYFAIIDFYSIDSNNISKDIKKEFRSFSRRVDRNSESSFQDAYGFDVFELREQILKYFFEERTTPLLNENHHIFLLKNEKDILRSLGDEWFF